MHMQETFIHIHAEYQAKIALIADLHEHPYKKILRSLADRKPDMIMIAGDLVNNARPVRHTYKMEEACGTMDFLNRASAAAPVYYSLGNHEKHFCQRDIELIRETGVTVLENTWVRNGNFVIAGLSSYKRDIYQKFKERYFPDTLYPHSDMELMKDIPEDSHHWLREFEKEKGYRILLSHHPECWDMRHPHLKDQPIDLVLSGHAHGGQWRYYSDHAWHGVFAPEQGLFPKLTEGMHTGPYGSLVISRGCAADTRHIPRLFNPPEIVYIDIGDHF